MFYNTFILHSKLLQLDCECYDRGQLCYGLLGAESPVCRFRIDSLRLHEWLMIS